MSLKEQFLDACKNGNLNNIKILIDQGANIYVNDDYALHIASLNGYLNIVKLLVEHGADIHAYNDIALRNASYYGHLNIVKFLVEHGANIHTENDYALRWASINGHLEIVKFLVEHGAPLHLASDRCHKYIDFCKRMEHKGCIRAQKTIYFWWIPICYDMSREYGKRMAKYTMYKLEVMMK